MSSGVCVSWAYLRFTVSLTVTLTYTSPAMATGSTLVPRSPPYLAVMETGALAATVEESSEETAAALAAMEEMGAVLEATEEASGATEA